MTKHITRQFGPWIARVVRVGDPYGRDLRLSHSNKENGPMVEVYDTFPDKPEVRAKFVDEHGNDWGQLVSRWYLETLLGESDDPFGYPLGSRVGLDMCAHVPKWSLTAAERNAILGWAQGIIDAQPDYHPIDQLPEGISLHYLEDELLDYLRRTGHHNPGDELHYWPAVKVWSFGPDAGAHPTAGDGQAWIVAEGDYGYDEANIINGTPRLAFYAET